MRSIRVIGSVICLNCSPGLTWLLWAMACVGAEDLPTPVAGWKVEVVAKAPAVRHPSVVCCAPDGRIFVAEDPMDISTPKADMALGRILCIHPSGRMTVFAERLHAVFGMQYLEGKLYVLHNPKLSRFVDDDGIGKDRVDLIECTNPKPWALDWNDHVPANFRLCMDGFFYMAVGDKGVYGAVGRDGTRVDLHGGGILRLRPEATELEVYSTGMRNILDVAANAEGEIFTYDNTDEQQWMSRLTHAVDGGFYGYPFDFIPRRPHTLWMMADFGGGAATGAFAYTEDSLPASYHDSLFLADFGKRQILRVGVWRAGGSFEAVLREDLFPDPPADFRPVGICLSPDGRSIYICDWQHRDVKAQVVVGRLLKLTYLGATNGLPKPRWYLPTASARPFQATTEELLAGLAHPAQSVRLTAQRRLAERGESALAVLCSLLNSPASPERARWHAIWALDAIDGGRASRADIQKAARDGPASVRRQAIRQLGFRRTREALADLLAALGDEDRSIRFQAATALGRIGDTAAVTRLIYALDERDVFVRYAVFYALRRIATQNPAGWRPIVQALAHEAKSVSQGASLAIRDTFDLQLLTDLEALARDQARDANVRATAIRFLADMHRKPPLWKGEWWAYHPANLKPPARTVAWEGTRRIASILCSLVHDRSATVRLASVTGLEKAKDQESAEHLRQSYGHEKDVAVRAAIVRALGTLGDPHAGPIILDILKSRSTEASLLDAAIAVSHRFGTREIREALVALLDSKALRPEQIELAVRALGLHKYGPAVPALERLTGSQGGALRQAAMDSLVQIGGTQALDALKRLAVAPDLNTRIGAVRSLGEMRTAEAGPLLLEAYQRKETRDAAIAALTQQPDRRATDAYLAGLASEDGILRQKCVAALREIRERVLPGVESRVQGLDSHVVALLRDIYANNAQARRGPIFQSTLKVPTPADYLRYLSTSRADAARGKTIFHDAKRLACTRCHKVDGQGGEIGPDLSTIGEQLNQTQLAESLLFPSQAIREGYHQMTVVTTRGKVIHGLVRSETESRVVLRDADGKDHDISKSDMEEYRKNSNSLMPEGLIVGLPLQDFADLVAFLKSLGSARKAGVKSD